MFTYCKMRINWAAFAAIILAAWLGLTGRVDWWVIILVGVSHIEMFTEHRVRL